MIGPALGVTIAGKGIKETTRELDAFRKAAAEAEKASLETAKADTARARAALDAARSDKNSTKEQLEAAAAAVKAAKAKESDARAAVAATRANDQLAKANKENAKATDAAGDATKKTTTATDKLSGVSAKANGAIRDVADAMKNAAVGGNAMAASAVAAASRVNAIATVAAVAAAGLSLLGIQTINYAHEVDRLSTLANASAEDMQRIGHAAKTVGFEMRDMADIYKDFNDRVGDFNATGAGPLADFFENIAPRIGMTKDAFNGLSGPQGLQLYVDSLEKAGASQQEMTFYMEAVASESTRLLPLLRDGGAEMDRLADRAEALGGVLSNEAVGNLAAMRQSLTDVGTVLSGLGNQFGAAFAPLVASVADAFTSLLTKGSAVRLILDAIAAAVGGVAQFFGDLIFIVSSAVSELWDLAKAGAAWIDEATGISKAIDMITESAIVTWLYRAVTGFADLIRGAGGFGNALALLKDVAVEVFGRIKDGFGLVPLAVKAGSDQMQAWFANSLVNMYNAFATFTQDVASGLNALFGSNLHGAQNLNPVTAPDLFADLAAINGAARQSAASLNDLAASVTAPLASIEALRTTAAGAADALAGDGGGIGGGGAGSLAGAAGEAAEAANGLADEVKDLNAEAAKGLTAIDRYTRGITKLEQLKAAGLSDDAYSMEMARLNDEFAAATPMIDDVANAFGKFVVDGFKDFKSFTDSVVDSFKSMLADMISMAVRNQILIPIATSIMGGGGAGIAGLAGGAGGAGAGSLLGTIGTGAGLAGGTGFLGGASAAIGGGNMLAVGANAAAAGGGAMATLGAVAVPIAAAALAVSFLSKSTKTLDSGMRVTVKGMDAVAEAFSKTRTTRYWGLSTKTRTAYKAADAAAQDAVSHTVSTLQGGIMDMASVLGVGASAFRKFTHSMKVSTKGMNEDQALAAVQAKIIEMGDAFAGMVPGLNAQIRYGESATEALTRLSTSMAAVSNVADLLGHRFNVMGVAGGALASSLADAFGGIEAMNTAAGTYWDLFYTEQEKVNIVTRQTAEALASLGLAMPKTREEYRRMVEAMNLTDAASHKAYAALISLSGSFDTILPPAIDKAAEAAEAAAIAADKAAEAAKKAAAIAAEREGLEKRLLQAQGNTAKLRELELAALDKSNRGILKQIWALEDAAALAADAARAAENWASVTKSIGDWINDMRGTISPLTGGGASRAANEAQYQMTLARAMAGDPDAMSQITGAADNLLSSVGNTARTGAEAASVEARILADLSRLVGRGMPSMGGSGASVAVSSGNGSTVIQPPAAQVASNPYGAMVAELVALRKEIAEFKDQSRQIDQASFAETRKIANRVQKWDSEGLPPERAPA